MLRDGTRRSFKLVVGAVLGLSLPLIGAVLSKAVIDQWSWGAILGLIVAGFSAHFLSQRRELRSSEENPEAIKVQVGHLHSELRSQVKRGSFGARSKLIAAPLKKLDLDITPRVGLVRDPSLTEPDPISEKNTDIVAAFTSSKRRLLIVGEPGAGKTTAAYTLIEYLDETEGDERVPLLVNLSAWEAQESFEAFLVDYLISEVGYQVRKPAVASAFVQSRRYTLVLDGLDEIPAGLRTHFSERLDKFLEGLPSEVAVVVTCRTQEYQELREAYTPSTSLGLDQEGLGLVQAVEILPLTSQQLDSAFTELAKVDNYWKTFLTQRHLKASQRARDLLSSPLFLNLAVIGRLRPGELLNCDEEEDLRDLVLERYLDRALLVDQSQGEPKDVRRYLTWVARFLNGDEVSPFGLKTKDSTVFDLADLTPPDASRRYRLVGAVATGLGVVLVASMIGVLTAARGELNLALTYGLGFGLVVALLTGLPYKRSAVSSRLTLVWPSTIRQLRDFIRGVARGLLLGLLLGLLGGLVLGLLLQLYSWLVYAQGGWPFFLASFEGLGLGLLLGLGLGLGLGLVLGLVGGLVETRPVLITSRTPKEVSSRSLIAALIWLVSGLAGGRSWGWSLGCC